MATKEYAELFRALLDKQIVENGTSGFMEDNAGSVIYSGGKEAKIPVINLKGLDDYDRDEGYSTGAVTYNYETRVLSKDRGRRFRLDAVDVSAESFEQAAADVAAEFQRVKVIPEIDAYRYSKLSGLAGIKVGNKTITKANAVSELTAQISEVLEATGGEGELVVVISRQAYDALCASADVQKTLEVGTFQQGDLSLNIKRFNGAAVIPVPQARLKSAYDFVTGDDGGFAPTTGAVDINWLVMPKNAPVAVSRTDTVKIIPPELNQFADAWDIDYRKYHDLFLPENKAAYVAACFKGAVPAVTGD
ncbi:MAG: hypothetical protein LBN40_05720 [Oscillospiraceae bacterium]|jgi:hypothetical protein|nr:hypothetical protein [Oscillospiraceae bacterium]